MEGSEKKILIELANKIKTCSSHANYFANQKNIEHVDLLLTGHFCTHQSFLT